MAETIWEQICDWSEARTVTTTSEWSPEDWPMETRLEIDVFLDTLMREGFEPPILYRSEYVDCWSMGDVFWNAMEKANPNGGRQLQTGQHEIIANWVDSRKRIEPLADANFETVRLYRHINDAAGAWGDLAERRLIVLVRTMLRGLWTDHEVAQALKTVPSWCNGGCES